MRSTGIYDSCIGRVEPEPGYSKKIAVTFIQYLCPGITSIRTSQNTDTVSTPGLPDIKANIGSVCPVHFTGTSQYHIAAAGLKRNGRNAKHGQSCINILPG